LKLTSCGGKTQLTAEERNWIWGVIGKRAAMKLSGDAPDYFARGTGFRTCMMITWPGRRARHCAGRWQQVLGAITAMGDSQRNEPTWVYWRARALMQLATEGAQCAGTDNCWKALPDAKGFYEQLALEELGQRITVPAKPAPLTAEEKKQPQY
jgi:soluble lytic murein transglycosylase